LNSFEPLHHNEDNIMTSTNPWTDPTWTVVRADLDIAHVMLPLCSFKLQTAPKAVGEYASYVIAYKHQAPAPDSFGGVTLVETGEDELQLSDIPGITDLPGVPKGGKLPPYDTDSATLYTQASELMSNYLTQHSELQRLEAIMQIPCHAHGSRTEKYDPPIPNHLPFTIKTTVQLYQISDAVTDGSPLLVIRTPLSPTCPVNGNGTAIGVGKY
jgi:hypothetical protein